MDTQQIRKEARILAEIMMSRKIGAMVELDSQRRPAYTITPSTVVYRLRLKDETPVAKVYNLQLDFASRITRHRAMNGIMADTFVRVDINEQTVEVNRVEPESMDFASVQWNARPNTALCGVAYHFGKAFPLLWRLDDSDQPHALVAGTTGSGKTNELMTIILSLALHNSPVDLRFSLIDMKRDRDLQVINHLPHLAAVASDEETSLHLLHNFHAEMNRREMGKESINWRHVLVIDELATLLDSSIKDVRNESMRLIEDIARKCRSSNMNLLLCTQTPKAELLGGQLRNLLALRLVGAVTSNHESDAAVGIVRAGAEMLPGKGAMIYRLGRTVKRFQAPLVATPMGIVHKIQRKWSDAPLLHRPAPVAPSLHHPAPVQEQCQPYTSEAPSKPVAPVRTGARFPLVDKRPLTASEAAEVRQMAQTMSKNELCNQVYGSKSSRYMEWINAALTVKPEAKPVKPFGFYAIVNPIKPS
jgi:hypothetical protein